MTGLGKQLPHDGDAPDVVLDVTGDVCPMTFVRTRLRLDQMAPGQVLEVRFRGAEPRENLPRSLRDLGQELLAAEENWLRVRKR
jgi:TusA-related sulfurtransferase